MSEYEHWNDPSVLPPVGCPLVVLLCGGELSQMVQAERTAHVSDKSRELTYRRCDGHEFVGRFPWTYP